MIAESMDLVDSSLSEQGRQASITLPDEGADARSR
jgi:hypothetical protein